MFPKLVTNCLKFLNNSNYVYHMFKTINRPAYEVGSYIGLRFSCSCQSWLFFVTEIRRVFLEVGIEFF